MDKDLNENSEKEAAAWFARRLPGRKTLADEARFLKWRSSSSPNDRSYKALQKLWRDVDDLEAELLADEFERQLQESHTALHRARQRRTAVYWMSGLAAACIVASIPFLHSPTATQRHQTAIGERLQVTLEDGSDVHLNTSTEIAAKFSKSERRVELDRGEAVFTVAHNQTPFRVKTPNGIIEVTGTVFDVRATQTLSTVSVLSGSVSVTPLSGTPIMLRSGQMIEVGPEATSVGVRTFDPRFALSWRTGRIQFDGEELDIVVSELNRYFKTKLRLGDSSLANLPVTGEFDIQDQDAAVAALALAFSLEAETVGAEVVLRQIPPGAP